MSKTSIVGSSASAKVVDSKYNDESANFALISADGVVFLVHKHYLLSASSVFRHLIHGCNTSKGGRAEIKLVDQSLESHQHIRCFLGVIDGTDIPDPARMEYISWQEVEKLRSLLVLADKYDCPLALQMLKGLVISYVRPDTEYDESMDLFRLTTEYHLNDTVVRILKLGVEWESPAYMLGKEDGEGWSFHPSAMERDFFESIPSPYAWCLVRACLDVPHRCDVDGKYEAVDRFEKLLNTIAANENDARIQKRKREADESAKAKKKKVDEEAT